MESSQQTPQPTKRQLAKKSASRPKGSRISSIWDSKAKASDLWKTTENVEVDGSVKPFLLDEEAIKAYGQVCKLPMIHEKFVDPSVRDKYNLTEKFSALNCISLLDGSDVIYPDLVRQFYANLFVGSDNLWVKSSVKGKEFKLTTKSVSEALKIPNSGLEIHSPDKELTMEQVLEAICDGPVHVPKKKGSVEFDAYYLKEHLRVTNRICHTNIFPKATHTPKVRMDVSYFLYCVETGTKCNMARMMIARLCEPSSFHIIYPGFLTKIFKYHDISLENEVCIPNTSKFTMENVRKILAERDKGKTAAVDEEKLHPKPERVTEQLAYLECSFKWLRTCLEDGLSNIASNQKKIAEKVGADYEEMELPDYEEALKDWFDEFDPPPTSHNSRSDPDFSPESGSSSKRATRSQKKRKVK